MNRTEFDDLRKLIESDSIFWDAFNNSRILVTGGTGLIGSMLTKLFLLRNEFHNANVQILSLVRDASKARNQISMYPNSGNVQFIEGSVESVDFSYFSADYVVHTAAPTKSSFFIENPVETIDAIVLGTRNVLNFARDAKVKAMVNVSSMESYGTLDDENVTEDKLGFIPLDSLRSSYPESKRLSELMVYAYSQEYKLNATSLRLAQTFGAGITENENRVFKYFCDRIMNNEDIVLKSTGETKINFCYLTDAIKAILILLTNGLGGEIYNASGDSYNMTIKQIAQWLLDHHGSTNKLIIDVNDNEMYAPVNRMILNSEKLKMLGWAPEIDIKEAYLRLIESLTSVQS